MTTEDRQRHRELKRLLNEALDLPVDERSVFLRRSCEEAELRQGVVELLDAFEETAMLNTGGAVDALTSLPTKVGEVADGEELVALSPGDRVGAYQIVDELGRGGMAVVYGAERVDGGFDQEVAIKVARPSSANEDRVRRFSQERQILASLDHPHIARLLDGGFTAEGAPFFALEKVDGERLDSYCDSRRLGIPQRLRLFLDVAEAVEYAHRNLVVHRDLKPSNILVTREGRVKLLDFGIAKLLEETGIDDPGGDVLAMTPAYASPEQVKGEAVTTASDIYQLGLLLYELLAGCRPYRQTTSPLELMKAICEEAPDPPSHSTGGTDAPGAGSSTDGDHTLDWQTIGESRGLSPQALRRKLRGDLDSIILKALCKQPEQRYATVRELVDDLCRHLEGRPISTRSKHWAYVAGKLIARHRLVVTVAAIALLTLTTMVLFHTARLAEERDLAQEASVRSTALASFLEEVFSASNPYENPGQEVTLRDLLDRAAQQLDQLQGQVEARATLAMILGRVYLGLGDVDSVAGLLLETSVADFRSLPEPHPRFPEALIASGRFHVGESRVEEGKVLFEEAIQVAAVLHGPVHDQVGRALMWLGDAYLADSDFGTARTHLLHALDIHQRASGPVDADYGNVLYNLGRIHSKLDEYPEAIRRFEETLEIYRQLYPPGHPRIVKLQGQIALIHRSSGANALAVDMLDQVLAAKRESLGAEHPDLAITYNRRGVSQTSLGEFDAAEADFRKAISLWQRAHGDDYPGLGSVLSNWGRLEHRRGNTQAALEKFERSRDVLTASLGPDHLSLGMTLVNLGDAQKLVGDYSAAEASFAQAFQIRAARMGEDHPRVGQTLNHWGDLKKTQELWGEAEIKYRAALRIQDKALAKGDEDRLRTLLDLAICKLETGDLSSAETFLVEVHSQGTLGDLSTNVVEQWGRRLNPGREVDVARLLDVLRALPSTGG